MQFNFHADVILENDWVKLEPMASKHFDELLPITLKNPELLIFSTSRFETAECLQEYFQEALGQKLAGYRYPFVIFDKTKKVYIGSISIGYLTSRNFQVEIGWSWIGKEFQGTGINKHCKYLLLDYVFETLLCKRVVFKIEKSNIQLHYTICSNGGKYEGESNKPRLSQDGHLNKFNYYSVLEIEWPYLKLVNLLNQQN